MTLAGDNPLVELAASAPRGGMVDENRVVVVLARAGEEQPVQVELRPLAGEDDLDLVAADPAAGGQQPGGQPDAARQAALE